MRCLTLRSVFSWAVNWLAAFDVFLCAFFDLYNGINLVSWWSNIHWESLYAIILLIFALLPIGFKSLSNREALPIAGLIVAKYLQGRFCESQPRGGGFYMSPPKAVCWLKFSSLFFIWFCTDHFQPPFHGLITSNIFCFKSCLISRILEYGLSMAAFYSLNNVKSKLVRILQGLSYCSTICLITWTFNLIIILWINETFIDRQRQVAPNSCRFE